ncbi:DUF4287 domain-containing protein [Portibacter lacus]|uniref:DUF5655 domain-containing protein n=1 Tax=Portibacter lacus TaxID=1099794 RepID=A0AA37SKK5_9BACT|nr:DUF4287 domain-containing protein [Portibacter lacus]GLR15572.1 hypothetical protein GCM10007940_01870 [Portibacter lacus]
MEQALKTMIDNMPEKTGKSLDEWKKILKAKNFAKHGEAMKFLKGEHGVTHGFANTIVSLAKKDNEEEIDLVAAQYTGKESLRPIYDEIISIVSEFGDDVTITPKKTSVSLIRAKQFALIKPATKTRIDLGLKIKDQEPTGILENSGPFGTMCTHRIKISGVDDLNEEVVNWMKTAYTRNL